jgi:hypothetical protein
MMRQAGRYLPGYKAVRARHSFLDMCRSAELAAQVSLEPIERFDVDAAIVFADILLTADAGRRGRVSRAAGRAPHPLARGHANVPDATRVRPTMDAIGLLRRALPSSKAVIGFSAAPLTLVAYLVEGGTSRDFTHVRRFLYEDRRGFAALLDRAADALAPYLREQAASGADALQLFDTWGGIVSPEDYRSLVVPAIARVLDGLGPRRPPTILFAGLAPAISWTTPWGLGRRARRLARRPRGAHARLGRRVRLRATSTRRRSASSGSPPPCSDAVARPPSSTWATDPPDVPVRARRRVRGGGGVRAERRSRERSSRRGRALPADRPPDAPTSLAR